MTFSYILVGKPIAGRGSWDKNVTSRIIEVSPFMNVHKINLYLAV